MVILESQIDKHRISDFSRETFEGRIEVVDTLREAEKAVEFLNKQKFLGLDTETKPVFRKNTSPKKVALLQIATENICFLFRLNYIGLPPALIDLLSSDAHMKVGLSFHDDIRALRMRGDFQMGKWIDLQRMARELGIMDQSLQKIYANVFHRFISKSQRLSNWEVDVLTDAQKKYAATDAWACLNLYNKFQELKRSHDYVIKEKISTSLLIDRFIADILQKEKKINYV